MKRSPALCCTFLLLSAAFVLAQSPAPQGTNQPGGTQSSTAPAPTGQSPANAQPGAPQSTTAQGSAQSGATQPDGKSGTAQPNATQPGSAHPDASVVPQTPAGAQTTAPAKETPDAASSENTDAHPELQQPKTEILDSSATSNGTLVTDGHDPILDPPPLPGGNTTLVGGTVTSVDHIRNHMTVAVFSGAKWKIGFDERTHIYRNGAETTQLAIKKGERVYVDTMLDRSKHEIFARNVRMGLVVVPADADGQIVSVDTGRGLVTLRDRINSTPVLFSMDRDTKVIHGNTPGTWNDLRAGSLVHVKFSPQRSNQGLAREIAIIAAPGSAFTFVGKVTYLDMHRGILAMDNLIDKKNYEVRFDPARAADVKDSLGLGTEVRIVAIFEGTQYTAQSINVTRQRDEEPTKNEKKD